MNVTDLRQKLRRSPLSQIQSGVPSDRRKVSDRRKISTNHTVAANNYQRVWLTPGERALIEDLYLLNGE